MTRDEAILIIEIDAKIYELSILYLQFPLNFIWDRIEGLKRIKSNIYKT